MSSLRRDYSYNSYGSLPFDENALLLPYGRRSFLPAFIQRFNGAPIDMGPNTDREAYHLNIADRRITLLFSGMGSPVTANALEKAAANGVKRVILFGACGGIATYVNVGDIVVPTAAIRGEGTSRYYLSPELPAIPDAELTHRLLERARSARHMAVHTGVVYTTDASYRQGPEVYENPASGIIAADCECSAAFVVAAVLNLQLAALFFCTDNIRAVDAAHRSRQGLENDRIRRAFELSAEIAVGVLAGNQ